MSASRPPRFLVDWERVETARSVAQTLEATPTEPFVRVIRLPPRPQPARNEKEGTTIPLSIAA
jgi:hypothetical protein